MISFKRIATRVLIRLYASPVLGNLSSAVTSAILAYLAAKVPFVFEGIGYVIRMTSDLPSGTEVNVAGVSVIIAPIVFGAIKAFIQEILFRWNNKTLDTMSDYGLYDGKMDGFIGPVAHENIQQLILHRHTIPKPTDE